MEGNLDEELVYVKPHTPQLRGPGELRPTQPLEASLLPPPAAQAAVEEARIRARCCCRSRDNKCMPWKMTLIFSSPFFFRCSTFPHRQRLTHSFPEASPTRAR